MPFYLCCTTYLEMYEQNLLPIRLADLQQDMQEGDRSSAPITRIQKGRLRKQILRPAEARIGTSTYSTCGQAGNNARMCRRPYN